MQPGWRQRLASKLSIVVTIAMATLPGCTWEQRLDDVSNEPKFKSVVGSRYVVARAVAAYGIREHSGAAVDYITLIPPPGIDGPEVGFRMPVRIGSTITVLKVYRTNRWPDPDMTLGVRVEGTQMPVDAGIRMDLFRGNEGEGEVGLNPDIYRKL
jgi:hypothetical protein